MDRIGVKVPPPLADDIETFQEREGFENKSQAIRELLRRGLNSHDSCSYRRVVADGRGEF